MKMAIIGGGSVGLLMASFLAEQGVTVTMITKRNQQASRLETDGLTRINTNHTLTQVPVYATTSYHCLLEQDIICVAVKYTQLSEVLHELSLVPYLPPLLFLQNGLAHYEQALSLPHECIAFASVSFGAQRQDDKTVIHRGIGIVNLSIARGDAQWIDKLLQYKSELLPMQVVENAEEMLFQKAFINCLINPLTFVLNVQNGVLVTEKYANLLLRELYKELTSAFPEATKISLQQVEEICHKTSMNTSSMLSDRLANRPTEIESIVGAMLSRAEQRNKTLPILQTLYHLVLQLQTGGNL